MGPYGPTWACPGGRRSVGRAVGRAGGRADFSGFLIGLCFFCFLLNCSRPSRFRAGPIQAHMGPYGPLWAHMGPKNPKKYVKQIRFEPPEPLVRLAIPTRSILISESRVKSDLLEKPGDGRRPTRASNIFLGSLIR